MEAQFFRYPIASTPVPSPVTGTDAAKPPLRMPHSVRSDGPIGPLSRGVFAPTSLAFGSTGGDDMAAAASRTRHLLAPARGNLLDILRK